MGISMIRASDGDLIFSFRMGQPWCQNCDDVDNLRPNNHREAKAKAGKDSRGHEGKGGSSMRPQSVEGEYVGDLDPYSGLFDDEQTKTLEIKEHLKDPDQSDDSLVELLQSLADMDITFQALKETDIGRHVDRLRKHSSSDVQRLVKLFVRF
ncbi:probable mediator of RNA polymerase II transcription subunit 26c [Juglans microcarpa x Juglans regia]|uniref:probable mediator of RNA polymerase II transcription subunit 26c n=1 Tax=Juglans microcarpa x Juglans regia TaxID=2249226 RepID=UPI001B7E2104|nr:probable mediator of RNA polymerase II transcription subunit 26c [Juglans microcarpa x Juglans regia]